MASTCSICVRKIKKKNPSLGIEEPNSPILDTCNHSEDMNNKSNSSRTLGRSKHKKNSSFDSLDPYKYERPSSVSSVRSTQSEISPLQNSSRRIVISPTHSLRSMSSRPHSRNSIDFDELPNYAKTTHAHLNRVKSIMTTKFNSTGRIGSVSLSAKYGSGGDRSADFSPKPKSRLPIPTYMKSLGSEERGSIRDWVPIGKSDSQEGQKLTGETEDEDLMSTAQMLSQKFRKPRKGLLASAGKKISGSQSLLADSLTSVIEEEKDSPEFNAEPIEISEDLSISHQNPNFLNFEAEDEIEFINEHNTDSEEHRSESEDQNSTSQQFNRPISFNEYQNYQNSMVSKSGNIFELMNEEVKKYPNVEALVGYFDSNNTGEGGEFDKEKFLEHYNKTNNLDTDIDLSLAPSQIITNLTNREAYNELDQSNLNHPHQNSIIPTNIEQELKQNGERLEKIKSDYSKFIGEMDKLKELFDNKESSGNKFRSLVEEFESKLSNELKELDGIVSEKPKITNNNNNENYQTLLDSANQISETLKIRIDKIESIQFQEISKPILYHVISFLNYSFNLVLLVLLILILTVYTHAYFNRFIQFIDFTNFETIQSTALLQIKQFINHLIFSWQTYTPKYILFTPDDNLAPIPQLLLIWVIITAVKKVLDPNRYFGKIEDKGFTKADLSKS